MNTNKNPIHLTNSSKLFLIAATIGIAFSIFSCGEKIEDFSGFLKSEMEFLLSQNDSKNWLRTSYQIDGQPIEGACQDSLIFQFTKVDNKTDTSGLVLVKPNNSMCDSVSFCNDHPDICEENKKYCEREECEAFDSDYMVAGSWFIKDPEVKNGKVSQVIIKNTSDSVVFNVNFVSSLFLEITSQNSSNTVFEKFEAE